MSPRTGSEPDWRADVGEADGIRRVFDHVPVVLLGLEGPEHRVVAVNAAYRDMVGHRSGLVGRTVREIFPELHGQQIYEMYARVFRTGVTQVAREWLIQLDRDDSGEVTDVYYDFTVTARRDAEGTIVGTTLVCEDVTARVRQRQRADSAERRFHQARDVIAELQRELLPMGLPVLPRARTAASYLPSEAGATAGGDWFDAVPLADGRLALSVGDVVGSGVAASAIMGRLRAVLEDRLLETGDAVAALEALERQARRLPRAGGTTVAVAVLDPAGGDLTYCTAGHPPPLLVGPGGTSRYLAPTGAGPLGSGGHFPLGHDRLAEGDILVLLTDGIVERPGRDHAGSLVELAQVAADAAAGRALRDPGLSPVARLCAQTVELLVRPTGHVDDVTVLAVQRVAPPPPLHCEFTAAPGVTRPAMRAVAGHLRALGASEEDVDAVRHAVSELVTNSVAHAYRGAAPEAPRPVTVTAELEDSGCYRVEVADRGRWYEHPPAPESGGLGLVLVEQLTAGLEVRRSPGGTTCVVRQQLRAPVQLPGTAEPPARARRPADDADLLLVLEEPHAPAPRVRVDGPVAGPTTAQLRNALQKFTRNGTRELTVDLTGVSLLASSGVLALQHALRRSREHGTGLHLFAPPGSPAQHVLRIAALPHTGADPHAR